jgi:hypothetical protein
VICVGMGHDQPRDVGQGTAGGGHRGLQLREAPITFVGIPDAAVDQSAALVAGEQICVAPVESRKGKWENETKDARRRLAASMIDQGGYSCTCSLMTNEIRSSTL